LRCAPGGHREGPAAGPRSCAVGGCCCATDFWTDDGFRIGLGQAADVGKRAIDARNERQAAYKAFKVVSYVQKPRTSLFWMVAGPSSGVPSRLSYVDPPGGEAKQIRGTGLAVWKKLADGSGTIFRWMGGT
jgi:hypothetical protein